MKHFKPYRLIALMTLLVMSYSNTYAHAVVTQSSLDVASIAPNQTSHVKLTFNSKIELDLSQIFLVSSGDKMHLLEVKDGKKPGQVIISMPPLLPGEYALKLKIFAADGHLSEDLVRFHVSPPAK